MFHVKHSYNVKSKNTAIALSQNYYDIADQTLTDKRKNKFLKYLFFILNIT